MPTRRLIVTGSNGEHFFLSVQEGTLIVGSGPDQVDIVLDNVRVLNLSCDLEVDEESTLTSVSDDGTLELQPGQLLEVGSSSIHLLASEDVSADTGGARLEPIAAQG